MEGEKKKLGARIIMSIVLVSPERWVAWPQDKDAGLSLGSKPHSGSHVACARPAVHGDLGGRVLVGVFHGPSWVIGGHVQRGLPETAAFPSRVPHSPR